MAEEKDNTVAADTKVKQEQLPEGVVLRDHVYDGIQEYDQRLPNWWLFTLYIMIVFFIGYWVAYYQFGWVKSDVERLNEAMAVVKAAQQKELEKVIANLDDEALWEMSQDPEIVAKGEETFQTICFVCHGKDLSATLGGVKLPGEPLNDAGWKYGGGKPMGIFGTVMKGSPPPKEGEPPGGMVPYETQLGAQKVVEVVAYILNHHEAKSDGTAKPKE